MRWGCVFRRDNKFGVRFKIKGETRKKIVGTEAEAEEKRALAAALAKTGSSMEEVLVKLFPADDQPSPGGETFKNSIEPFLEDEERKLRDSSFRQRKASLNRIAAAKWALKPLRLVRAVDINRWTLKRYRQKGRRGKPISTCAVNRDLTHISALFRWGIRQGYCEHNPACGEQTDRRSEIDYRREVWWTEQEMGYLFDVALDVAADFEPFLRLACTSGMRRGEIRKTTLRCIDLSANTLHVPKEHSKNKKARTFGLTGAARSVILEANPFRRDPNALLLVTDKGLPWTDETIKYRWEKIRKAAKEMPPEKRGDELRLHTARHSFATLMAASGTYLHVLAGMLGQSSTSVTERYAHCCPEAAQKAARAASAAFEWANRPPASSKKTGLG